MQKFKVYVEKNFYVTGQIEVKSKSPALAIRKINNDIKSKRLTMSDKRIVWNDDFDIVMEAFKTTGDVD